MILLNQTLLKYSDLYNLIQSCFVCHQSGASIPVDGKYLHFPCAMKHPGNKLKIYYFPGSMAKAKIKDHYSQELYWTNQRLRARQSRHSLLDSPFPDSAHSIYNYINLHILLYSLSFR